MKPLSTTRLRFRAVAPLALCLMAFVLIGCGSRNDSARRDGTPASFADDSLATLTPYQAYQRGLALGEAQHFEESLPYFRRALEVPPPAWQPYCDYAITLFHATHQTRAGLPKARPVTRSSYERVAMMREALAQLDMAEKLAQTAPDRAFVVALRARYLKVWGLAWDALSEYHRAATLEERHLVQAFELAEVMRDPVRARTTAEPPAPEQAPSGRASFPAPVPPAPSRPPAVTPDTNRTVPDPSPQPPSPEPDSIPSSSPEPDSGDGD